MDVTLKAIIKDELQRLINEKIEVLISNINELKAESVESSKNSAGDKHEVGRAMSMAELEKLSTQLSNHKRMLQGLENIYIGEKSIIQIGTLVKTSKGRFLISVSFGKLSLSQTEYIIISSASPLAKVLIGKRIGDRAEINGIVHQITQVV